MRPQRIAGVILLLAASMPAMAAPAFPCRPGEPAPACRTRAVGELIRAFDPSRPVGQWRSPLAEALAAFLHERKLATGEGALAEGAPRNAVIAAILDFAQDVEIAVAVDPDPPATVDSGPAPIEQAPKAEKPKPAPKPAPNPRPEPEPAPKTDAPRPSWQGLEAMPVSTLAGLEPDVLADRYIVAFDAAALATAGIDLPTVAPEALAARFGVRGYQIRSIQRRFLLTAIIEADPAQLAAIARDPVVARTTQDTVVTAAGDLSWGLDRLDAPLLPLDDRFERRTGESTARIYLFDSGVDPRQPEFAGRAAFGGSFPVQAPTFGEKCHAHGTEMASIIAGAASGVAPGAEFIDVAVLPCGRKPRGGASSIIEAAEWTLERERTIADGKPAIVNMSLAGPFNAELNRAVRLLHENGLVVVTAAGNEGGDACRYSPASAPEAITVAATDARDRTPAWSNRGRCVDLHAPGDLLTASTDGEHDRRVAVSGTSAAAALVSGVLARRLTGRDPAQATADLFADAAPGAFWRQDDADARLTQISGDWRSYCRVASADGVLNLRAAPSASAPVLRRIADGALVRVDSRQERWARVRTLAGDAGWVAAQSAAGVHLVDVAAGQSCAPP